MTAIDFAAFVEQLATASGEAILPFFRTSLAVDNKKRDAFDPVTAADRGAENDLETMAIRLGEIPLPELRPYRAAAE